MVNIVLAFDEQDDDMGSFNQGCKDDYEDFLRESSHNVSYIGASQLNSLNIQFKVQDLPTFVFAAYSHGHVDKLYGGAGGYISTEENYNLFKDSFFYTVSCHTGSHLAGSLMENGCKCYFGYNNEFHFWTGYKDFSDCANWGFVKFLEGEMSHSIYTLMLEKYNTHIDAVRDTDFVIASLLRANRDALVMLGANTSISDFDIA